MRVERSDDRLAILAVPFSFCFIAADDITLAFDLHLLDEELRLARFALNEQRREKVLVFEDDLSHNRVGALPRAENIFKLARFEPLNRRRRDHAAIGDDADASNGKTRVLDFDLRSYFDNVRHDRLLEKVAQRVDDADIMHLLKVMLKSSGKKGIPQGGVMTP